MAYIPDNSTTYRKRNKPEGMDFLSATQVLDAVEKHFEVKRDELLRKCRRLKIVYPRQVAMYLLAHYTVLSLKSIGVIFEKDHTTVIHSMEVIDNYISTDSQVKDQLDKIILTF